MPTITLRLGAIQPKQRPRRGKHGQFYTPKETVAAEKELAMLALAARNEAGIFEPTGEPVEVEGIIKTHGDLDNALKTVLDACNGILFADDRQIWKIHVWRGGPGTGTGKTILTVAWD